MAAARNIALVLSENGLNASTLVPLNIARRLHADGTASVRVVLPGTGPLTRMCERWGLEATVLPAAAPPPPPPPAPKGFLGKLFAKPAPPAPMAPHPLVAHLADNKPDMIYVGTPRYQAALDAAESHGLPAIVHQQEAAIVWPTSPAATSLAERWSKVAAAVVHPPGAQLAPWPASVKKVVCPNGVDVDYIAKFDTKGSREDLNAEFSWDKYAMIAITVAPIAEHAGIDLLWQAAYDLFYRHQHLVFLIVGPDGPDAGYVRQVRGEVEGSEHAHRFQFAGAKPDVAPYLRGADLFVAPWRGAAQPVALLEALGAGLPCVTTDVGDIPPMCKEGEIAFLHPAGDPQPIQEGIEKILSVDDVRKRYRAGGPAKAREFTWDASVAVVREVIRES